MSKKEKNIEVTVKDIQRNSQPIQQVFIGEQLIGEVSTQENRFKALLLNGNQEFSVQSQEEGLETILQQYHLHQRSSGQGLERKLARHATFAKRRH